MATPIANEGDPASAAIIQIPKPMRPTAITVDAAFSITEKTRPLLCHLYDGATGDRSSLSLQTQLDQPADGFKPPIAAP
jgi:hypothetical protein